MWEIIDTGKDVLDEYSVSVGLRQEHWESEHAFHPGLSVLHRDFLYTLKAGDWDGMMQCVSFLYNDCTEMSAIPEYHCIRMEASLLQSSNHICLSVLWF